MYDAIRRHDAEVFVRAMHPEVEGVSYTMSAEGQVYRGHEGMRRFLGDIHDVFPDWRPRIGEVVDRRDVVVAEILTAGRGATSGVELEQTVWQVVVFRNGKVAWWRGYSTRDEALDTADRLAGGAAQRTGTST
ncbi:MAG: nuclear transport factor 2 family protein [Thermoleophilaceae bacterium]